MKIVLDATEIIRDPSLSTVQMQMLREFARLSGAEVVVPEVVLQEAMCRMDEDVRSAADRVQKAMRDAGKWLGAATFVSGVDKWLDEGRRRSHIERLRSRLERFGARIRQHPEVPHTRLVDALRVRRRPFSQKGQGYPDALIWCTVLDLAKDGSKVVLITQNKNDFPANDNGIPDPGLLAWFDDCQVPSGRVLVYHSMDAFSTAVISPAYPVLNETVQIMTGRHPKINLRAAITAKVTGIVLVAVETSGCLTLNPPMSEHATVEPHDLRVDIRDVRYVSKQVQVAAACAFYIDLSRMPTLAQVFDRWTASFRPWSADTLSVSAEVSATFDRESGAVMSFEIHTVAHGMEGA